MPGLVPADAVVLGRVDATEASPCVEKSQPLATSASRSAARMGSQCAGKPRLSPPLQSDEVLGDGLAPPSQVEGLELPFFPGLPPSLVVGRPPSLVAGRGDTSPTRSRKACRPVSLVGGLALLPSLVPGRVLGLGDAPLLPGEAPLLLGDAPLGSTNEHCDKTACVKFVGGIHMRPAMALSGAAADVARPWPQPPSSEAQTS